MNIYPTKEWCLRSAEIEGAATDSKMPVGESTTCSPSSLTPETQKEWELECPTMTMKAFRMRDKCRQMELESTELAGYLCRIKLPLPVKFVANLEELFPGKNVRMRDKGGYLCIFTENNPSPLSE